MSFFNGIREDIERVLEDHETTVEGALGDASKLAQSKTAQAALAALHMPAWTDSLLAEVIQELDNGFAQELAKHQAELEAAKSAAPAELTPTGAPGEEPPAESASSDAGQTLSATSPPEAASPAVVPAPNNVMP